MFDNLRNNWRSLKKDEPGQRFQNRNRRAREEAGSGRSLKIGLGVVLIVVGVAFLLIPGPGSVLIIVGIALLAEESGKVARALDGIELWMRNRIRDMRSRLKRPSRQSSKRP